MVDVFATGVSMGESPRWHDGRFWMCDWLPDGRMLTTTPRGAVVGPDLAPYGGGDRGWNELVVDPSGRAYVDRPGAAPGVVLTERVEVPHAGRP